MIKKILYALGIFALLFSAQYAHATVCTIFNGCTGTSTTPAYGNVLVGGKNGEYEFVATSTFGGGGGAVSSVFGRTGAVVAQAGDYTTAMVTEATNLYFTAARVLATTLSGFSATTGTISSSDTVLSAIDKLAGNAASYLTNVTGLVTPGTNITITGSGTSGSPYVINSSGSGGTGLSTTSPLSASNLLVYSSAGAGSAYGVSTSTLTASSPLTGSFTQIGSGGTLGCQTASGSQAGCLASADWTTFNSKQSALTFSTGLNNSGGTITNTGVLSNIAGTGIGVSGATGNVTISNTGVTSIIAGTNVTVSGSTGAVTINSSGGGSTLITAGLGISTSTSSGGAVTVNAIGTSTNTLWVDASSSNSVNSGSINAPFLNTTQLLAGIPSTAPGVAINLSPGTYVNGAPMTLPNIPVFLAGNESTLVVPNGLSIPSQSDLYDLSIIGNVNETDTSLTLPHQMNNGYLQGSYTGAGNVTFDGMATGVTGQINMLQNSLTNIAGSAINEPLWNSGTMNINDDEVSISSASQAAITATSTYSNVFINGATIINTGGGAGINVANGATSTPNVLSNFTVLSIGTSVAAGSSATALCNFQATNLSNGLFNPPTGSNWKNCYFEDADVLNNLQIGALATPAGAILAVDPSGNIIATTTGGSSFITSLTTTGSSGAATVSGGVLNIPIYGAGSGTTYGIENPSGTINGSNTVFTVTNNPTAVYLNGAYQTAAGVDYTLTGTGPYTITFVTAPDTGSILRSQYATAASLPSLAGITGSVQFNNGGALGSNSGFFWDNTDAWLGIGSSTPGSLLSLGTTNGINFSTATSTFNSTGGINIANGCFAVSGVCVGGGSGGVGSGTQGQFPFYNANGSVLTATSTLFLTQGGSIGIGSTSPAGELAIQTTAGVQAFNPLLFIASSTGAGYTTLFSVTPQTASAPVGGTVNINSSLNCIGTAGSCQFTYLTANRMTFNSGGILFQSAGSNNSSTYTWSGTTPMGIVANTNLPIMVYNFNTTRTHTVGVGALAQNDEIQINPGIETFSSGTGANVTITNNSALTINGAPQIGARGAATNAFGLMITAGTTLNASTTNAYGLGVAAPTGAANNYAASTTGRWIMNALNTSTAGNAVCQLTTGELVGAGAVTCATSSKYTKYDIRTMDGAEAMKEVQALQPVLFDYIDGNRKNVDGVIAEQAAQVAPGIVDYATKVTVLDGHTFHVGDPIGVDPAAEAGLLFKAMQYQQTEIEAKSSASNNMWLFVLAALLGAYVVYNEITKRK